MTLEEQYSEVLRELLSSGMPPDEADRQASAAVTPAGQPNRYANEQLASVGGFIGDPTKPGSNRFSTAVQPSGTSSYSPAPVMPPWMVEQAGQANELAGYNPQSVSDLQDAYGGLVQDPTSKDEEIQQAGVAKLRGLVDPNRLEDERKMAVGSIRGAAGNVPEKDVDAIDSAYKSGIPRFLDIVKAGGDPAEADATIFNPIRSSAKGLVMEKRYRESSGTSEKERSFVFEPAEFGIGSDKTIRLTPSGFVNQMPYLPEAARTNAMNMAYLREAGYETGQPQIQGAGGANGQTAQQFGSEAEARAAGAQTGDVVYLIGVGKVRLR